MVQEATAAPSTGSFDDLEAELGSDKAFAREEQKSILKLTALETMAGPEEWMERRQINFDSAAFREAYPQGLPVLHIQVEGVDVVFTQNEQPVPGNVRDIYIALKGDRPEQYGRVKGRRSHAHIITDAFLSAFGIRPFGAENQQKLIGSIAVWGQHLGEMDAPPGQSDKIEWAWDVPREALPRDFVFDGAPRKVSIGGSTGSGGGAGGTASIAKQLTEDEANAAIVEALTGIKSTDFDAQSAAVMSIVGLPEKWYEAAGQKRAAVLANEEGLIIDQGGTIAAAETSGAIAAPTA